MKSLLLSVLLLIAAPQAYSAQTIVFSCEDIQAFPDLMGTGSKVLPSNPGMAIEAIRLLEKKLNIKIVIKRKPWKRVLSDLKADKAQGAFLASYKDKRKEFGKYPEKNGKVDPSRRFTASSYALYRLKGSSVDFDGTNFKGITGKVGAPIGYSIVDDLRKKGLKVDEGKNSLLDLKKLSLGRLSAVAGLEADADFFLSENSDLSSKIEKVKTLITTKPYYFMLSHQFVKKNPALAEKIFDTLASIREDAAFKSRRNVYNKAR